MTESNIDLTREWPSGKTGYVALLGRPNAGKSTLVNSLLNYHLLAVSPKAQTTRRTCLGILSDAASQILFIDAPGVHQSIHALDEAMDRSIGRAISDADVIVCLIDPTRLPGTEDRMVSERAAAARKPVILAVNKVDIATEEQIAGALAFFREQHRDATAVRISALDGKTMAPLLGKLKDLLPEGPFLYDPENVTDAYERDIAAELIREALLEELRDEVPHCMTVEIDTWKDKRKAVVIGATLHVERPGQKGIVIGHNGSMLKRIRQEAIKRIRENMTKPVRLNLFVKLSKDWRNSASLLRDFGLTETTPSS